MLISTWKNKKEHFHRIKKKTEKTVDFLSFIQGPRKQRKPAAHLHINTSRVPKVERLIGLLQHNPLGKTAVIDWVYLHYSRLHTPQK